MKNRGGAATKQPKQPTKQPTLDELGLDEHATVGELLTIALGTGIDDDLVHGAVASLAGDLLHGSLTTLAADLRAFGEALESFPDMYTRTEIVNRLYGFELRARGALKLAPRMRVGNQGDLHEH